MNNLLIMKENRSLHVFLLEIIVSGVVTILILRVYEVIVDNHMEVKEILRGVVDMVDHYIL